jgi:hypothetical protein
MPGLLSLIILPLGWQFVDLTNWQRLLAVRAHEHNDIATLHQSIRKGLLTYAVESPFTWAIFLFFGLLALTSLPEVKFEDLLVDITKHLISARDSLSQIIGFAFVSGVFAIMLSTVDSFLVGIMFAFAYDSWPASRKILDANNADRIAKNHRRITNGARLFALGAIVVGMLLFV